jgi:hypothetical protein
MISSFSLLLAAAVWVVLLLPASSHETSLDQRIAPVQAPTRFTGPWEKSLPTVTRPDDPHSRDWAFLSQFAATAHHRRFGSGARLDCVYGHAVQGRQCPPVAHLDPRLPDGTTSRTPPTTTLLEEVVAESPTRVADSHELQLVTDTLNKSDKGRVNRSDREVDGATAKDDHHPHSQVSTTTRMIIMRRTRKRSTSRP